MRELYKLVLPDGTVHQFYASNWEEAREVRTKYGGGTLMKPPPAGTELQPHEEAYYERSPKKEEAVGGAAYTKEEKEQYAAYLAKLKDTEFKHFPRITIDEYMEQRSSLWRQMQAGYTDIQARDYKLWKRYESEYGEVTDWTPANIQDWLANLTVAQQQLDAWKQTAGEVDEYILDPAEAARRREEAYAESRYAAEERYREQPMYSETFTGWIQGQSETSQALQAYIKSEYPSLQAEYKAGVGALTGFPTREEARAEAGRRETGWEAWLEERLPETTQEYYSQRPYQRGERYRDYSPTHRTTNW